MSTTIIIGGVAAGMSAATRLRRLDESATIIVLEQGGHVSFANCGLPYHIGGVIPQRDALLLQTPESLRARFNLDVRTGHRVTQIDADSQTVHVALPGGATDELAYDQLIIATGAQPFIPPLPGIERAFTLRNVADMDAIITAIGAQPKTAVILGGGFIGIEMAENLTHRGIETTMVEMANQILPPFDPEMAGYIQQHLQDNGVTVITGHAATSVTPTLVQIDDGREFDADLVISSVGVRPDTALAKSAGLNLTDRGLIMVDEQQRTSDPNIFAAGDATAKPDFVDGSPAFVALAQSANRQGRLIADVVAGLPTHQVGVQGTAIIGAFGLAGAATGWTEKRAKAAGKTIRVIHSHPSNYAGYYPGATQMHLKLVIDATTDAILGAQAVGFSGIDSRMNVIATAMHTGMKASDLRNLELVYAPQFSSAKDPVNMLGYVADNLAQGLVSTIQWHELDDALAKGHTLIDIRDQHEVAQGAIPGSVNIPLAQLREQASTLSGPVIVLCQVGQRGHTAARLLTQLGVETRNLDGGYLTWLAGQDV